ncbi:MAG TPA: hypothetical protein PLP61_13155, partial [Nocardioides sp.]|uniref:hypothetical protein n=1 Tax=Nocardioides sp. TaxID=35761 RepID=UPI002C0BA2B3
VVAHVRAVAGDHVVDVARVEAGPLLQGLEHLGQHPLGVQVAPTPPPLAARAALPGGRRTVFGDRSFLVAYYGTAGTGALGVLGETGVDRAHQRLVRAARPFRRPGEHLQPVYELIVTVADAHPGRDGDYSHDIPRAQVRRYVRAAHRHGALLLLDLQPGRSSFLRVARRWAWALEDPWVGLALDPEWRMGRHQVPARVIGSVDATEVNRTSAWLSRLVQRHRLPQKLFVVHQFRVAMVEHVDEVRPRPGLALVQHVDGFGSPQQKLATYRAVVRPRRFTLGLKLFYDEDRHLMSPARVRGIRPPVRFVSYQ